MRTLLVLLLLAKPPAPQRPPRLFVSAKLGSDANSCQQAYPCATVEHALEVAAKVNPGPALTLIIDGHAWTYWSGQAIEQIN